MIPHLEHLSDRCLLSTLSSVGAKEIKTLLDILARRKPTLMTSPITQQKQASSAAQKSSDALPQRIISAGQQSSKSRTLSLESAFLVYDPAVGLAASAVTDKRLEDAVAELAGLGGRDIRTGRFVSYKRYKTPTPVPPVQVSPVYVQSEVEACDDDDPGVSHTLSPNSPQGLL